MAKKRYMGDGTSDPCHFACCGCDTVDECLDPRMSCPCDGKCQCIEIKSESPPMLTTQVARELVGV